MLEFLWFRTDNSRMVTKKTSAAKAVRASAKSKRQGTRLNRAVGSLAPVAAAKLVKTPRGNTMLALRSRLGLNRETFARLLPVSSRSLASIERGQRPNATVTRRLTEIRRVVDALSEVVNRDAIRPWMLQPNQAFEGLKPIEVIERGEVDRIWQMIFLLRSGTPS
jgi:DNA-binding transcriptional regulator YiaG